MEYLWVTEESLSQVYFDEDPKVTDVYKRDLFHHLFPDMFSTKSGMFLFNDSNTLAWFPTNVRLKPFMQKPQILNLPYLIHLLLIVLYLLEGKYAFIVCTLLMQTTKEDNTNYFLFGFLCGLALYNNSIIYLPFPLVLFKKLLDVEPTLEDMKEFSAVGKLVIRIIMLLYITSYDSLQCFIRVFFCFLKYKMCTNILEFIYTILVNCITLIVSLTKMCFKVK